MDMLKTIFDRRSIRKYTGEPVSRDKLVSLAKAGMAAPTSRDTRHFNFIIIDEESTINKLLEGLPYSKMIETAKHAIIVTSDLSIAHGGAETDYWIQDCSAAAQNITLAATALGLGACWTAAHPREERVNFVKQVLELPENINPLCVIAIGVPTGEEKPRDKFDSSHVFFNKWGKTA
ncbi:MAG: nitroreductase family protein [Candidatus Omnitrophica bacterium]|nr:nitroreductase family protein [Candidatus Omnitrophota bacterium]MBU1997434.1 nitroreductase family protein [Candidatus Omnitrophota bacterium]MBU4333936.1 nitroreductase family protein [Candidatus Omnitrophota bacterium]